MPLATPTLPFTLVNSTIGAGGLNDRVRDGNGCGPSAMIARGNNSLYIFFFLSNTEKKTLFLYGKKMNVTGFR